VNLGYLAQPILITCVFHGGRVDIEAGDCLSALTDTSVVEPVLVVDREISRRS